MSDSKSFKLTKADLYLRGDGKGDDDKKDIRGIISEFTWFESIDSPFVRCDLAILDSTNFDQQLLGTERLDIEFSTIASQDTQDPKAKDGRIKARLKLYKIGSVIKNERSKIYILHFAPEAMYNNETERAFGLYGVKNGKSDIVKRMLKDKLKISGKDIEIEDHSDMNVVCPNWRPVDAIGYVSDKVTRKKTSKGGGTKKTSKQQSGFLFYQNKNGYNFKSIDLLCSQQPIAEYTYGQKNVGDDDAATNMFRIESVAYPDRANQLEKMRTGVYQTCTIGIVLAQPTDSYLPQPSATTDGKPNGTLAGPIVTRLQGIFAQASTLEKGFPYDEEEIEKFTEQHPTRTKMKILPSFVHQQTNAPNGGADDESSSIMMATAYAHQRWNLLNTQTLTIKVSGNTALSAGSVIKINMPEAEQKNKKKLEKDRYFSGKYLIKGIKHVYTKNGVTSELFLCRDSQPAGTTK